MPGGGTLQPPWGPPLQWGGRKSSYCQSLPQGSPSNGGGKKWVLPGHAPALGVTPVPFLHPP